MNDTPTKRYIDVLSGLKAGDLSLLRTHTGMGIDESVKAFDLFAGLWWPLRRENHRAPRREVAWLMAKLYAACPIPHVPERIFARELRIAGLGAGYDEASLQERFDTLLLLPLSSAEPSLRWALDLIATGHNMLDWIQLTDDLSFWKREETRLKWANQYMQAYEREL